MAERRMFAKTIVLSDAFLDMPMSARCLYMTLGMVADDDGFVNSPRSVMRQCGASDDDMKVLIAKKFVLIFDSGVIVIKHWRINNYLQRDRYKETKYVDEKQMLSIDENGSYHREDDVYTQSVYTQDRLGKDSIGKDSIGQCKGESNSIEPPAPPTVDDVLSYAKEIGKCIDAERFVDYYSARGWKIGGEPMEDWRSAVRVWCSREKDRPVKKHEVYRDQYRNQHQLDEDMDALLKELENGIIR